MTLVSTITFRVVSTLSNALDLVTASAPLDRTTRLSWASGTGLNQADKIWSDTRTLAASGTEDIDLAGALTDALGVAVTFVKVKHVQVTAATANTNNVNVTRPAANGVPIFLAAGDGMPVQPGGTFIWNSPTAAGVAVTAGTGDLLTITNSAAGTGVTYDIIIIGTSA
jgi:hypothetical protein